MSTCATHSFFVFLSSPRGAVTIFSPFIVSVRRGNNIFLLLSSPCSAVTIFFSFYRHRAAREQYFLLLSSPCGAVTIFSPFIVTVQRGNNIFLLLSSPCGAVTIFFCVWQQSFIAKTQVAICNCRNTRACIPAIGIDFYFFQASIMALKSTGFSEAPPIKPPSMLGLAKSSPAFDALQLPP